MTDELIEALRTEPTPVDDVTRARWLARMGPELDAIADDHARRAAPQAPGRSQRRAWLAVVTGAAAAACIGWWLGHRAPVNGSGYDLANESTTTPAIASADRELLRPYVVSGAPSEAIAATLLAGRFSALEIASGQLVRISFDHDRDQRLAAVGPTRIAVTAAAPTQVAIELTGTLLVDARAEHAVIQIHTAGVTIRAQHATFSVQTALGAPVVFVDRGEILIDGKQVASGEWSGPESARTAAVVGLLRDHANAVAPPADRSGVLAIDGSDGGGVITERGAIVGTPPVWARLDIGPLGLVVTGAGEHHAQLDVREGQIVRLPPPATIDQPGDRVAAPATGSSGVRATHHERPPARIEARPDVQPAPVTTAATSATDSAPTDAAPPVDTAAEMYARAESVLRAGDRPGAEASWLRLVATYPESSQASSALYDLANLARARGDRRAAQTYLTHLLASSPPAALREPATYTSCRLHVDSGELDAATICFQEFRASFAGSSHDAEVLAWLAGRAQETGGCTASRDLRTEYLRRYPSGPFAGRAAACKEGAP